MKLTKWSTGVIKALRVSKINWEIRVTRTSEEALEQEYNEKENAHCEQDTLDYMINHR